MRKRHISICTWNINGIRSRLGNKLEDTSVSEKLRKHDIIILIETHAGATDNIILKDFMTYSFTRPRSKGAKKSSGGIAILLKDNLRKGVKIIKGAINECAWIKLDKNFFNMPKDLFIGAVYIPPRNSTYSKNIDYDPYHELENEIINYTVQGDIMLVGDFNARTGTELDFITNDSATHIPIHYNYKEDSDIGSRNNMDSKVCEAGNKLLSICRASGLRILNGRMLGDLQGNFTCFKQNGQSVVDYMMCHEQLLTYIRSFRVHEFMGEISDHCILSVNMKIEVTHSCSKEINLTSFPQKYIWNNQSAILFSQTLQSDVVSEKLNTLDNMCIDGTIDGTKCVSVLTEILQNVMHRSLQLQRRSTKNKNKKKWFTLDCTKLRQELRSQSKLLKKYPKNPDSRHRYFCTLKTYNKKCRYLKRKYKDGIIDKLESEQGNPKMFWKLLDTLKNQEINKNEQEPGGRIEPSIWYDYYKKLYDNNNENEEGFTEQLKNLEQLTVFNELDYVITEGEVRMAISCLKNKKAQGLDMISNEMIKCGRDVLIPHLAKIFNKILNSGSYPRPWSEGYLVPLFKKGSPLECDNYRGITISNNLAKLLSSILNNRFRGFLNTRGIMKDVQIGSMKGSRTTDHIFVLKTLIDKYNAKREGKKERKLYTCFVDFRKAFDSVWRNALLLKLLYQEVGTKFYNLIKDMYSRVSTCIKIGDKMTPFFESFSGVKQGDVISPILFNFFINDIPDLFDVKDDPAILGTRSISCIQYADDLVLMSETKEGLQSCLDKLFGYCKQWHLDVNTEKTKIMIFNPTGKKYCDIFIFDKAVMEVTNSYTYLGIKFTPSGSFTAAETELKNKGMKALFKLKKLIAQSCVKPKTVLHLFDRLIAPILCYGSDVWGIRNIKKEIGANTYMFERSMDKLLAEKCNLSICKYVLWVHKKTCNAAVLGELGRLPVWVSIVKQCCKFWQRLVDQSGDSLLGQAYKECINMDSQGTNSWVTNFKNMLRDYNTLPSDEDFTLGYFDVSQFISTVEQRYIEVWRVNINKNKKLVLYNKFKSEFKYEDYLDMGNIKHRTSLCKLRISAHKLAIEVGRYQRNRVPIEDRICQHCNLKTIENEPHFLLSCSKYSTIRSQVLNECNIPGVYLSEQENSQKYIEIIVRGDQQSLGKFCYEAFCKRDETPLNTTI